MDLKEPVVFFCSEYALDDKMPFAGGLGVLAADFFLEAGKQNFPLLCLGLAYHDTTPFEVAGFAFHSKMDTVTVWVKDLGAAKLYLLDSGDQLCRQPYDPRLKLQQQIFLAKWGIALLKNLGIKPALYHLNEGNMALVILALMNDYSLEEIKKMVVATKHTVLSGAGLFLNCSELAEAVRILLPGRPEALSQIFYEGTDQRHPTFFSATKFLIKFSRRTNAVSVLHAKVEKIFHSNSPLFAITNGIFLPRWLAPNLQGQDLSALTDIDLWQHHQENKRALIDFVNQSLSSTLDNRALTVVWARRLAAYKQPELIFSDLDRLAKIMEKTQLIIAGPVPPEDTGAREIAAEIREIIGHPALAGRVVFLPHYDLATSQILSRGADVWLNTPLIGKEACGTSTMKAGANGALILSTPDGWLPEQDWRQGGWLFNTVDELYDILEKDVIPLFYNQHEEWIVNMRTIMDLIAKHYTAERMLSEYKTKLYEMS
jgi:glycogen phosphorylase